MINNKKISFIILLIAGLLMIMPLVNAFGASIPYNTRDRPLYLGPGQEKEFSVSLSSSPSKMTTAKVEVKQGLEIASFVNGNDDYDIPAGGEVLVNMRVRIPKEAVEGSEYTVSFLLTDISAPAQEGTVGVGGSSEFFYKVIVKTQDVLVEPAKPTNDILWWLFVIILIIVIAIIIFFYYKQTKKNNKRK